MIRIRYLKILTLNWTSIWHIPSSYRYRITSLEKMKGLSTYKKSYAKGILRFLVMIHTFWPWARMDLCTSSYSDMYLTMTTTEICVVYTYSVLLTCQTGRYGIAYKAYWTLQPKLLYIQYKNSHRLQWF